MKNKDKFKNNKDVKDRLDKRIAEDKKSMYTEKDKEFLELLLKMVDENNKNKG